MFRLVAALLLAMTAFHSRGADAPLASPDPYQWLEEVTGPTALEWARARNAESAAALETGAFDATGRRILEIRG